MYNFKELTFVSAKPNSGPGAGSAMASLPIGGMGEKPGGTYKDVYKVQYTTLRVLEHMSVCIYSCKATLKQYWFTIT